MSWYEVTIATHPLQGAKWVRVVAHVRHNATGEIRRCETDEILDDDETYPSPFNWQENNYSCDCNRAIFFRRAVGKEVSYEDLPCSHGAYAVNLENPATGEIYYREYE